MNLPHVIKTEEFPEEFTFIGHEKIHVTLSSRVRESKSTLSEKRAVTLCMAQAESEFVGNASRSSICKDCLYKLENHLRKAMYDQKKNEYYFPNGQKF